MEAIIEGLKPILERTLGRLHQAELTQAGTLDQIQGPRPREEAKRAPAASLLALCQELEDMSERLITGAEQIAASLIAQPTPAGGILSVKDHRGIGPVAAAQYVPTR